MGDAQQSPQKIYKIMIGKVRECLHNFIYFFVFSNYVGPVWETIAETEKKKAFQ